LTKISNFSSFGTVLHPSVVYRLSSSVRSGQTARTRAKVTIESLD